MKQFNNILTDTAINQHGPLSDMQTILQWTRRLWLWRHQFHFNFINNSKQFVIIKVLD